MSHRNDYLSSLLWAFADEFSENSNKINTNFINLVNLINVNFKLNLKEDGNKVDFKLLSETYSNSFHNPLIGDIIVFNGRYKREFSNHSKLGHGGFGTVYKANNNFDEQIYAIKRQSFQKKYLKDENLETYNKMYKEIKLIAKLKNNFLLSYKSAWFEFYKGDLELFIQMDFYPLTLKYAIDEMKLDRKENSIVIYYISCELFQEILEGVNYLHSSTPPLIHRDLKPSNILITYGENGTFIKIADFGLATFHEHSNQSHTGKVGSNGYIAPEVTTNRKYDIKADMFSLGIIVLELFDISKIKRYANKEKPASTKHYALVSV